MKKLHTPIVGRVGHIFLYVFGTVILLLGIIALAINSYDWNKTRPYIAQYSQKWLGREIRVDGPLSLRLGVHPLLKADDVRVASPRTVTQVPILEAGHLEIRLDLWPLFNHRIVLPRLELVDAKINLLVDKAGIGNWRNVSEEEAKDHRNVVGQSSEHFNFEIFVGEALLKNVAINYQESLRAEIRHFETHQRVRNDLSLVGDGQINDLAFALTGYFENYLQAFAGKEEMLARIELSLGDVKGKAKMKIPKFPDINGLDAEAEASGKNLHRIFAAFGLTLNDEVAPFTAKAKIRRQVPEWKFDDVVVKIGPSMASGTIALNTSDIPAQLRADITSPHLRFVDLGAFLPKAAAKELPSARKQTAEAKGSDRTPKLFSATPFPPADSTGIQLDIKAKADRFEGPDKAALIKAFEFRLKAVKRELAIDPLFLKLDEGNINASLTYDNVGTGGERVFKLKSRLNHVNVGKLAAPFLVDIGLKSKKVGTLKVDELFAGQLNGAIDLRSQGDSIKSMMAGLSGHMDLVVEEGKMSSLLTEVLGMDVTEAAAVLTAKKQTTPMDCLLIGLDAKEGEVKSRVILASSTDSDILIQGGINLRDETIDSRLTVYPKDFSIGSFKSPINIKGHLSKPQVDLDRRLISTRIALGVALGVFVTPAAALLALVEPGMKSEGQCQKLLKRMKDNIAH